MANELQNKSPADTYKDVLHLGTATVSTSGTGLPTTTPQTVYDGAGMASKLKLSQARIDADNIFITNGTITSLSTPLALAAGGTGGTTTAGVKTAWGIDNVENTALSTWAGSTTLTTVGTITSGVWEGTTIPVSKGGTGATTAVGARATWGIDNVENTALSTWVGSTNLTTVGTITSGTWEGTAIPVSKGGTGGTTAAGARTALGLGSLAVQDSTTIAATGGTLTGVTIANPTITGLASVTIGGIDFSSTTIDSTVAGFLTIPKILSTNIDVSSLDAASLSVVRGVGSTTGAAALKLSQYGAETEDLVSATTSSLVSTYKLKASGTIEGTQLSNVTDHAKFRSASEAVNFGVAAQYSVVAASRDTVESHDSKFTTSNIAVGDVIRIKDTAGGTWVVREVATRTSDTHIVLTSALPMDYTNTTYFERISSAATEKLAIKNNGTVDIDGGGFDSGHLILGDYHLWIDSTGTLRVKNSAPTSDTDGTVVGTQA